jgi:hypothetical protein
MAQQAGIPPVNGAPSGSPFQRGVPRNLRSGVALAEGLQKLADQRNGNPSGTPPAARQPAPAAERQPQAQAHAGQAPQSVDPGEGGSGEQPNADAGEAGDTGEAQQAEDTVLFEKEDGTPFTKAELKELQEGSLRQDEFSRRMSAVAETEKAFKSGLEEVQKHGAVIKAGAERVPQLLDWVLQQVAGGAAAGAGPAADHVRSGRVSARPGGLPPALQHHQASLGELHQGVQWALEGVMPAQQAHQQLDQAAVDAQWRAEWPKLTQLVPRWRDQQKAARELPEAWKLLDELGVPDAHRRTAWAMALARWATAGRQIVEAGPRGSGARQDGAPSLDRSFGRSVPRGPQAARQLQAADDGLRTATNMRDRRNLGAQKLQALRSMGGVASAGSNKLGGRRWLTRS